MNLNPFQLHQPESVSDAAKILKENKGARLLAGGTFLINQLKQLKKKGLKTPSHIISLDHVEGLRGIEIKKDIVVIKAMTRISEIADNKVPFLSDVAQNIATTPIRNMATIGGNLTCRYTWTEFPTVMLACNADLHFADSSQTEVISTQDFLKNGSRTDKILTHVSFKKSTDRLISYQRVKKTLHLDVPILAVCISTEIKNDIFANVKVAINTGEHFAQRDNTLESFLEGKSVAKPKLTEEACTHFDKDIVKQLKGEYKIHMHGICVKDALNDILKKAGL